MLTIRCQQSQTLTSFEKGGYEETCSLETHLHTALLQKVGSYLLIAEASSFTLAQADKPFLTSQMRKCSCKSYCFLQNS